MKRAAVLIGVSRSGDLPALDDAVPSARAMESWALAQGMDRDLVKVVTDEAGPVGLEPIKKAIHEIVERATVQQLVVFFSGHGVVNGYFEYWLLSDAPADPLAAVNVDGSVTLARRCPIPHVIFFSDACRTAAAGLRNQSVSGGAVFPNPAGAPRVASTVDNFFACALGDPAYELKTTGGEEYHSLYTRALTDALNGLPPTPIDPDTQDGHACGLLRVRRLKDHLGTAVAGAIAAAPAGTTIWQIPDALITSDDKAWVAQFPDRLPAAPSPAAPPPAAPPPAPPAPVPPTPVPPTSVTPAPPTSPASAPAPPPTPARAPAPPPTPARAPAPPPAPARAPAAPPAPASAPASASVPPPSAATEALRAGLARPGVDVDTYLGASSFAPSPAGTGQAFKVRGARVVRALGVDGLTVSADGLQVSATGPAGLPASVLLTFDHGPGLVLPAFADLVGALTFAGGELVTVAYEPNPDTARERDLREHAGEVERLRALLLASAKSGALRLDDAMAEQLDRPLPDAARMDPTIAAYVAYAYRDLQRNAARAALRATVRADLGVDLFDVALLAGSLDDHSVDRTIPVVPFVPLLSRGWGLLDAHRVTLPGPVMGLRGALVPSLYTVFDASATTVLTTLMEAR